MNTILFFNDPQAPTAGGSVVGGKGANLIVLTAAGFPVPPGFVVTAQAYQEFLDAVNWLKKSLPDLDYDHPDHLRDQCAQIRRQLLTQPLPTSVENEIRTALQRTDANAAFAVRSSSTFEDLAQAAFAGQHDTYLNVRGPDQIVDRVRACFCSLWEDRAVLYRHHQGFSQTAARMAVVVQRQIECHVAGVGFSIDPIAGRMDRMIIDANYGLGESVVSGEGEVDHFELSSESLQILTRSIGNKERMIVPTPTGVAEQKVPPEQANKPCLTDDQITSIAKLLQRVQSHYGWPQDIEWGITPAGIHLLQARPVTTIQPEWTRDESAERFPNPMTPLSWDFISIAFRGSLSHSLALMGFPALKGDWFQLFDHYIYGNQSMVRLVGMFRPLRAKNAAELVAEIPALRRRFAWVTDLPVYWARDLDRYLLRLGRLESCPEPTTLAEAWKFTTDVLDAASDYFLPNIAISMTQSALHRLLHGLLAMIAGPEKALVILDGLLAGCETKTAMVNREIHEMAAMATETPQLQNDLSQHSGKDFFDSNQLTSYPKFATRFSRFLADHGHREVDMDYAIPTWSGQPWIVLDSISLILKGPTIEDPTETMRAQRIRFALTEQTFINSIPEELRFFFRELIRLTRTYTMLDDLEHYQTTRINPLAHRAALTLGKFLVNSDVLESPADIFFLNKSDIESLVTSATPTEIQRCRTKAQSNKAGYEQAKNIIPDHARGKPAAQTPASGKTLRGLAGSPGRATGPCFIVRGPEDFARFPAKSILVARTTNPAWTPLFYAASAVITESGGPLSHGAVTAREMNLPAVMSVRGIMTLVKDGQLVTVDGTNGIVELAQ